jgi:hypothetical protein
LKYWRGYLVAGILAAVTFALVQFAKAHGVLVDMIYPYVTRLIITSMADWTGGMDFCLWQALVVGMVVLGIASATLMIILRWHPVQWFGWILAVVSCVAAAIVLIVMALRSHDPAKLYVNQVAAKAAAEAEEIEIEAEPETETGAE